MQIKHLLKEHAYLNIPLTYQEAYDLGVYTLEGCSGNQKAQMQSLATLCALHNAATYAWRPGNTRQAKCEPKTAAEQIAGVCAAIFERDIATSEFGFLEPDIPYAMDNCGMGGDFIVTANVSTIAAFIAAAGGIKICKHGSPANADQGRHGSSDFISLLGIDTFAHKETVQSSLETTGFGYTEAIDDRYKQIHVQTHRIAELPHMNDIIGPITNPLHPKLHTRKILGVNHLVPPRLVAEAYQILNAKGITDMRHLLVIRGFAQAGYYQGMDEVSICPGGTQIAEMIDNTIKEYHLTAVDFGLRPVEPELISPPASLTKGAFSKAIIEGTIEGAPLEMVLANTALLFYLNDPAVSLKECYHIAEAIFGTGKAYSKVAEVRQAMNNPCMSESEVA